MQNENLSLGSKVSDSRKKLGLSQEALAEKANVSLSTIQRIEKGIGKPRAFTLKIIAETLELDTAELFSFNTKKDNYESSIQSLKRMNLYTLLFVFIPFVNSIAPAIIWKKDKQIIAKDNAAGKMMSFQLLWSILTLIGITISILLSNLIIGESGEGHYAGIAVYLFAVLFNIFIIIKTSSQLNKKDKDILLSTPNLF